MIGCIRGTVYRVEPPYVLIDVGGVGYEVAVPFPDIGLCTAGEEIRLFTHHIVRDDAQQLYGFTEEKKRALFRMLIKVSGIGSKTALAMLSTFSHDDLCRIIEQGDTTSLQRVPCIGKKSAERLFVELGHSVTAVRGDGITDNRKEAYDALVQLGFSVREAKAMLEKCDKNISTTELVTQALRLRKT